MVDNIFDLQKYLKGYITYDPHNGGGLKVIDTNSSGIDLCRQTTNGCYSDEYISITSVDKGVFKDCIKIKALQNDPRDSSVSKEINLASFTNFDTLIYPPSNNKSHIILGEGYYYQEYADASTKRYGFFQGPGIWYNSTVNDWIKVLFGIIINGDTIKYLCKYGVSNGASNNPIQSVRISSYHSYVPMSNGIVIKTESDGLTQQLGSHKSAISLIFMTSALTEPGNPEGLLRFTNDTLYIKDWKVYMFENDNTFPNFNTEIAGNSGSDIIKLLNQMTQRHFIFQKN